MQPSSNITDFSIQNARSDPTLLIMSLTKQIFPGVENVPR